MSSGQITWSLLGSELRLRGGWGHHLRRQTHGQCVTAPGNAFGIKGRLCVTGPAGRPITSRQHPSPLRAPGQASLVSVKWRCKGSPGHYEGPSGCAGQKPGAHWLGRNKKMTGSQGSAPWDQAHGGGSGPSAGLSPPPRTPLQGSSPGGGEEPRPPVWAHLPPAPVPVKGKREAFPEGPAQALGPPRLADDWPGQGWGLSVTGGSQPPPTPHRLRVGAEWSPQRKR